MGGAAEALRQTGIAAAIIADKVKSVVKSADILLCSMTEGRFGLNYTDSLVVVDAEKNRLELAGLENTDRLLVYLSLLMAQPAHNGVKGSWLILDERILCNRARLNKALSRLDNIEYASE